MTICIAAKDAFTLVGIADRMLTSGDIQFEPSAANKIVTLTNSVVLMTAGDAAFNAEIIVNLGTVISDIVKASGPTDWIEVERVARAYIGIRNHIRLNRSENKILAPLGLTHETFRVQQSGMNQKLVNDLAIELLNFSLPDAAVIVMGVDNTGSHIYVVDNGDLTCHDSIGFAAIGSGSRHAESQFMLSGHSAKTANFSRTLLLTYTAKKRAERAPGVGMACDIFFMGFRPGSYSELRPSIADTLDLEYNKLRAAEEEMLAEAERGLAAFVDNLPEATDAGQVASPGSEAESPEVGETDADQSS